MVNSRKSKIFRVVNLLQWRVNSATPAASANQRLKTELFANDNYKERHDSLPSTKLYRGTRVYAYPAKDLDILDTTIRGVVRQG